MEIDLTLAPTTFMGDPPERDDYGVYWTSEEFGRQSVGRIRQAVERTHMGSPWVWSVNPPLPIPSWCTGTSDTLDEVKRDFRKAFEIFATQISHERWVRAFRTAEIARR